MSMEMAEKCRDLVSSFMQKLWICWVCERINDMRDSSGVSKRCRYCDYERDLAFIISTIRRWGV